MSDYESEEAVLQRITEENSADISGPFQQPSHFEGIESTSVDRDPRSALISEGNVDVEEGFFTTPVPDFVDEIGYNSFDDAYEALKKHTDSVFVNATITSSTWKEGKDGEDKHRTYGVIQCHKSRKPPRRNHVPRATPGSRNGCSARTDCPFKWVISKNKIKKSKCQSKGSFFITAVNNQHNHIPDEKIFNSLSAQRKLDDKQMKKVQELMEVGLSPADIEVSLTKNYPDQTFVRSTIYQNRLKIRKQILGGRTPVQRLVDELDKSELYRYSVDIDNNGKLQRVFFAHVESIKLYQRYSTVLVMDSTYKTNKHSLPLFEVCGITNSNSTFLLGTVFLCSEEQKSYEWALKQLDIYCFESKKPIVVVTDRENALINAIHSVLPNTKHLLCRWHINKNIDVNISKHFPPMTKNESNCIAKLWKVAVNESFTQEEFEKNLLQFKNSLPAMGRASFEQYLQKEWIPYKEKFVQAWTKNIRHFNTTATSRVEGMHATVKRFIKVSNSDLDIVFGRLDSAIKSQLAQINHNNAVAKDKMPTYLTDVKFFSDNSMMNISTFALEKAHNQYLKANKSINYPDQEKYSIGECKHSFSSQMGIPCSHKIKEMLENQMSLTDSDFDQQWWISLDQNLPVVCDTQSSSVLIEPNVIDSQMSVQTNATSNSRDAPPISSETIKAINESYKNSTPSEKAVMLSIILKLANGEIPLSLRNPEEVRKRGRTKNAGLIAKDRNISSVQRNSSAFEYVEAEQQARSRKCGNCQERGHDKRTCLSHPSARSQFLTPFQQLPSQSAQEPPVVQAIEAPCLSEQPTAQQPSPILQEDVAGPSESSAVEKRGQLIIRLPLKRPHENSSRSAIADLCNELSDVFHGEQSIGAALNAPPMEDDFLTCKYCETDLLDPDYFGNNTGKFLELRATLKEREATLISEKNKLNRKGKLTKKKHEAMVADLVAEFCRQHTIYELDVDLDNNGCPQIGQFIPKKTSLSQVQRRIEAIINSQVFQEEVLIAGKSRFKGVYSDSLSNLVGQEFTPVYAKQAIAHSLTGIYIVGYYGDDGSEVIFNVLKRLLPKNKLRNTPWSSCMPQHKDYVPLLAFTMVLKSAIV